MNLNREQKEYKCNNCHFVEVTVNVNMNEKLKD